MIKSVSAHVETEVVKKLKNNKLESTFKKAAMNILVKMESVDNGQIQRLKAQFEAIDQDNSGMISAKELARVC